MLTLVRHRYEVYFTNQDVSKINKKVTVDLLYCLVSQLELSVNKQLCCHHELMTSMPFVTVSMFSNFILLFVWCTIVYLYAIQYLID